MGYNDSPSLTSSPGKLRVWRCWGRCLWPSRSRATSSPACTWTDLCHTLGQWQLWGWVWWLCGAGKKTGGGLVATCGEIIYASISSRKYMKARHWGNDISTKYEEQNRDTVLNVCTDEVTPWCVRTMFDDVQNTYLLVMVSHCCLIWTSPSSALLYRGAIMSFDHRSSSMADSQHKLPDRIRKISAAGEQDRNVQIRLVTAIHTLQKSNARSFRMLSEL